MRYVYILIFLDVSDYGEYYRCCCSEMRDFECVVDVGFRLCYICDINLD